MTAAAPSPTPGAKGTPEGRELNSEVQRILGPWMGVWLIPRHWHPRLADWQWVALVLAVPALAWVALDRAGAGPSEPKLVTMIAWGTFYFGCASYLAQQTTRQIYATISEDILPFASPAYARAVAGDLREHYPDRIRIWLPLLIGGGAIAAAWWVLDLDLAEARSRAAGRLTGERMLWGFCYFVAFLTAAMAVVAARFYLSFARKLELESSSFHVAGAADTPLVRGLSRLATQVLIFWSLIFIAILSSMLLAVLPPDPYRLSADSKLLFTMVPIAGFFSLGFGTFIYLAAEAKVRATLHRFASREAAPLQRLCSAALHPPAGAPPDVDEAKRLADLQDRIVAGARYGSRVGVSISVALPLIMPVVGIIVNLAKR